MAALICVESKVLPKASTNDRRENEMTKVKIEIEKKSRVRYCVMRVNGRDDTLDTHDIRLCGKNWIVTKKDSKSGYVMRVSRVHSTPEKALKCWFCSEFRIPQDDVIVSVNSDNIINN